MEDKTFTGDDLNLRKDFERIRSAYEEHPEEYDAREVREVLTEIKHDAQFHILYLNQYRTFLMTYLEVCKDLEENYKEMAYYITLNSLPNTIDSLMRLIDDIDYYIADVVINKNKETDEKTSLEDYIPFGSGRVNL